MIEQLHKILRPFMIRRLKADVAKGLPPKTETLLMVGMSKIQKQLYKRLLLRDIEAITGKNTNSGKVSFYQASHLENNTPSDSFLLSIFRNIDCNTEYCHAVEKVLQSPISL